MTELTPVTTACSKFATCLQRMTNSMRETSSCTMTTPSLCQLLIRISCRSIIMPMCCSLGRSRCTDGTTVLYTLLVECMLHSGAVHFCSGVGQQRPDPKRITPARLETLERRVNEKTMIPAGRSTLTCYPKGFEEIPWMHLSLAEPLLIGGTLGRLCMCGPATCEICTRFHWLSSFGK